MDDFGTGYSSLSCLKRLPVNVLKIDISFIREIVTSQEDVTIAGSIIALAHSLGLKVVAEGVEEPSQLSLLRELGCDSFQGYLFRRPVPAVELERLVSGKAACAPLQGGFSGKNPEIILPS